MSMDESGNILRWTPTTELRWHQKIVIGPLLRSEHKPVLQQLWRHRSSPEWRDITLVQTEIKTEEGKK